MKLGITFEGNPVVLSEEALGNRKINQIKVERSVS